MKNYNPIADGAYMCERRTMLKDFCIWKKMTDEEKSFFRHCYQCKEYAKYAKNKDVGTCPCLTCEHRKTEIQVDNRMTTLRRKYF